MEHNSCRYLIRKRISRTWKTHDFSLRQVMELYTSVQGRMVSFARRMAGWRRLVIMRTIPAPSRKTPRALYGFPPAGSRIVVLYVESLIFSTSVLMRLKLAC